MSFITHRRTRLYVCGIVVMLVGLSIVGLLSRRGFADDTETDDDVLLLQEKSKAYDLQVQRNVGGFGLLMSRWAGDIAQLGRPRPLALTVLIVSGLTTGCCFLAASRQRD